MDSPRVPRDAVSRSLCSPVSLGVEKVPHDFPRDGPPSTESDEVGYIYAHELASTGDEDDAVASETVDGRVILLQAQPAFEVGLDTTRRGEQQKWADGYP